MSDDHISVDTEALEKLLDIRQQQATVHAYVSRAEEQKSRYRDAVLRRVLDDYRKRGRALAEEAKPLKVLVEAEHDKLLAATARLRARLDAAVEQREELELRRQVGELDEVQFQERLAAPTTESDDCRTELTTLEARQARFSEALAGGDDLSPVEPPPGLPTEVAACDLPVRPATPPLPTLILPVVSAPAGTDPSATRMLPALDESPVDPGATRMLPALDEQPVDPGATRVVPALRDPAPPGASAETADLGLSPGADAGERTVVIPSATVRVDTEGADPAEYVLGALTTIGRSDQSRVCLQFRGISRQHAVIVGGPTGFVIKDAGSQNGTYVNGLRVESHPLVDGDSITVGSARLVFSAAPPARPPAAGGKRQ